MTTPSTPESNWNNGFVWLIVAGPALVVLASFITLYLAITKPDPVVDNDYYNKGININKTLGAKGDAMAPAMQARNQAVTGFKPAAE